MTVILLVFVSTVVSIEVLVCFLVKEKSGEKQHIGRTEETGEENKFMSRIMAEKVGKS